MGIFSSKKGKLGQSSQGSASAGKNSDSTKKKRSFGLRKFFSFMFAAPETKVKSCVDVYNRPTFMKSLKYEPGKGYGSVDVEYGTNVRCTIKSTGRTRFSYNTKYDFDSWDDAEIARYDMKFKAVMIDDEVADLMKMALKEIGEDEMEIGDFGSYSEADVKYEEIEVPMAKPSFLPEIIREEAKEEPAEEEIVEIPVVEETAVETVELIEQPIQIEAPTTLGLLAEPKAEEAQLEVIEETPAVEEAKIEVPEVAIPAVEEAKVEAPVVEEAKIEVPEIAVPAVEETVAPVVEEAKIEVPEVAVPAVEEAQEEETSMFSFGFGDASEEESDSFAMSFGFGAQEEADNHASAFVSNSVFKAQEATNAASL